jgi:F-type H+-transporting ATPase subunit b
MLTRFVVSLSVAAALAMASSAVAEESGHGAGTGPAAPSAHGSPAAPAAPAHGGGHGGTEINPLDFQRDLALWTAVVFLVLMAILWRFAWGPIADSLDKREQRIADQIAAAEQANVDARKLLEEYQGKLTDSEAEVRGILDQGRRDAEEAGRRILETTRNEARREKERAVREIDAAAGEALKELAERSADLAIELAGKIVESTIDRADHARLIEQAVAGFAKIQPGKN